MKATESRGQDSRTAPSLGHRGEGGPASYERYFVPAIAAPLAAELVGRSALEPGVRVLDVACGTGVVARMAAATVGPGAVTGIDADPGMLEIAESVSDPHIEWYQSAAESMTLPDDSQDVAFCQMGMQFFSDKTKALQEIRRLLVPRGRLIASVPGPAPQIFRALERTLSERISPYAARFVAVVFSLYEPAEIERLFISAGYEAVDVERRTESLRLPPPGNFLWEYVLSTPLGGVMGDLDDAARESFEREVLGEWEQWVRDGSLELELELSLVTAAT